MLLIAGTVPDTTIGVTFGEVRLQDDSLEVSGIEISRTQGTAAMISAAAVTMDYLGIKEAPRAAIAGDVGDGAGSRKLYKYLIEELPEIAPDVLALHYLMPIIPQMEKLVGCAEKLDKAPLLIADAGSMYAAKAAGLSKNFALMTPDRGEMSFLADPEATHPAYIRHHILGSDDRGVPELIVEIFENGNAPDTLIVKGSTDYVAKNGKIVETICEPDVPEMEAIGGTGDTITGMAASFIAAGLEPHQACILAARANRTAGEMAGVTPASPASKIIAILPGIFKTNLCSWSGICAI